MKNQISYLSAPVFVWWNITYACNLRCKQCYSSSGKPHPHELNTQEAKEIIRQLADLNVFYIYILGGEPLLRDDIFELSKYAHEHNLELMMSTNGWFITHEIAQRLEKIGFMHVRVSIDGASAETHDSIRGVEGSFERAVNAVKLLTQTEIPRIGISPTVLQDNVEEMSSLIELAVDLEVDEMQLVQLCATGRGSKIEEASIEDLIKLRKVFERYRKKLRGVLNLSATEGISIDNSMPTESVIPDFWGCSAGRTCLAIEAEGTVQPCILYPASAGNLRHSSLEEIWHNSPLFRKMRAPAEFCRGCAYVEVCSQECPIDSCVDNLYRQHFAQCSKKEVNING